MIVIVMLLSINFAAIERISPQFRRKANRNKDQLHVQGGVLMHSSQEVNQETGSRKDPQDSSAILESTISRAQKVKSELMYSIQTAAETIASLENKTEEIKSHYPSSSAGPSSPGTAVSRERAAMMEIPET